AGSEGASGLLEGVALGHSVGLTALAALPHAADAELALPRLCALLLESRPTPALSLLRSVHAISARPPTQREPVAPGAHEKCLPAVQRLAERPGLDATRHDLASSTLELLRERRE